MKEVLISERFDDIYFSKEDGLAETQHVFIEGNTLPTAWQGRAHYTICETGFGTGLNFFSAWKLFEETTSADQHLDFISFEKYPLHKEEISDALEEWRDHFEGRIERLCDLYPLLICGFHRVQITDQITLTLIFDDVNEALPKLTAEVDCWFLDGFTPAKNPEMWTDVLYENMARLSVEGARYATFTAAGDVRRGLEGAGFSVEKQKGFGRKRDMIAGRYEGGKKAPNIQKQSQKKVAIIGGGLAGTSCAYVLKQYGFEPVIYEADDCLGHGASGNEVGLYNPRFSKLYDPLAQFYASSYTGFISLAQQAGEVIEYNPCGKLYLITDEKRQERYNAMIENWGWGEDYARLVDAQEASDIAGIEVAYDALYLPHSGSINPRKLCAYYAQDIEVHLNYSVTDLSELDADAVILCCGSAVSEFEELSWLELRKTRGQLSTVEATQNSSALRCHVNYGGYISAMHHNQHVVGATFEKEVAHTQVTQESHAMNMSDLQVNLLKQEDFKITDGRAAHRVATSDHFPVIGAVPNSHNIYVSAALGSYGVVSSLMGAKVITDMIRGGPQSLPHDVLYALSPRRFVDRAAKKGRVL